MAKNLLFAKRLETTMKQAGYWNEKRRAPDIGRFCTENGYLPSYVNRWLKGEVPRPETLFRLAHQLDADPKWLVGFTAKAPRRPVPIAGGSSNDGTIGVGHLKDGVLLIRTWLLAMFYRSYPAPTWTPRLVCA